MKIEKFRNHDIKRTCKKNFKDYHSYKKYLQADFSHRCCYCNLSEKTFGVISFQIDHFIPKNHFKNRRDELETLYENLMLTCPKCNRAKSDQYEGDIESPHIENRLIYNPDQVNYTSIFYRDALGQIASDDPKGKAMIRRLKLYRPIHSYAWILEKLTHIIERLDERVSVAIGDEKVRLEEKRNQLSNEYFKIYRQFVASYLSGR